MIESDYAVVEPIVWYSVYASLSASAGRCVDLTWCYEDHVFDCYLCANYGMPRCCSDDSSCFLLMWDARIGFEWYVGLCWLVAALCGGGWSLPMLYEWDSFWGGLTYVR